MKCIVCDYPTSMKMNLNGIEASFCYEHFPFEKAKIITCVC